jgi:YVTN family beta-propeller protein
MKNVSLFVLILLTLFSFTFSSCDDDDNKPAGEFEKGIFVVNEGNFTDADGTISHISTGGAVTQDLFGAVNNGLALGSVVQSMTIDGDLAYIVVNNSNKMEVVNANTFASAYTLSDLSLPRYFITFKGKGYVTEWVSFADPGRVSIVDLQGRTVTRSITTDYGAENIMAHQDRLYVSNNFSNTISVIDPVNEEVIKTIEVGSAPGAFVVDDQNTIWVICGGGFDQDFNPLNDGKLVQIDPGQSDDESSNSVLKTIELGVHLSAKAVINKANNKIFYFNGKSVYAVNTSDTEAPPSPLITESAATNFYGIGIDPENDMLYVSDDKAFAGNGVVYRYSLSGILVDQVAAGRGPNGFVFK